MRLTERVHLAGSGTLGFGLSHDLLAGHLCLALRGGQSHIQEALDRLGRMLLPASIF